MPILAIACSRRKRTPNAAAPGVDEWETLCVRELSSHLIAPAEGQGARHQWVDRLATPTPLLPRCSLRVATTMTGAVSRASGSTCECAHSKRSSVED
jgi:hypothetical protein